MRLLLIHPNYHSGGAEIAGHWPPAWAAYIAGAVRNAGHHVDFIDAMTDNVSDDDLAARIRELKPDVVGCTSITASIYKAEQTLKIARESWPQALTLIGGVHATFMFKQVLTEAPWIDAVVRGEGEEIIVEVLRAWETGDWAGKRASVKGIAYTDKAADGSSQIVATEAAPTVKDLDGIDPDWDILDWPKYQYIPLDCKVAIPNMARGCPFTCSFCSQWKFWRDYRVRDPKKVVDEIEYLYKKHDVRFFILADEEPTINRKKFVAFCEELIARGLPDKVQWGINTRVTDILRDEELLPLYRKAGLLHVSLGTEAAAQLKLDLFNKETKVADNKRAIDLLRQNGMVVEAQFIVGLENETAETLEETYKMTQDWKPDLANWSMYTPWPFTPLFQELQDKVEVFDFEKYNFVTPIMKPAAMDRGELLDRVMNNYRRFYAKKALFSYPWSGSGMRRRYLLGCLKAFLKAGFQRKFYDLGKVGYWGPQSKKTVDFQFDMTRKMDEATTADWKAAAENSRKMAEKAAPAPALDIKACGGGDQQLSDEDSEGIDEATLARRAEEQAKAGGDARIGMRV